MRLLSFILVMLFSSMAFAQEPQDTITITDPLKVRPVRLMAEGIPRVMITDAQFDIALGDMQERVFLIKENVKLNENLERQKLVISNLKEELKLEELESAKLDTVIMNKDKIIVNKDKIITAHENKEKWKKVEDWLERAGAVIVTGLAVYGGYELGKSTGN